MSDQRHHRPSASIAAVRMLGQGGVLRVGAGGSSLVALAFFLTAVLSQPAQPAFAWSAEGYLSRFREYIDTPSYRIAGSLPRLSGIVRHRPRLSVSGLAGAALRSVVGDASPCSSGPQFQRVFTRTRLRSPLPLGNLLIKRLSVPSAAAAPAFPAGVFPDLAGALVSACSDFRAPVSRCLVMAGRAPPRT